MKKLTPVLMVDDIEPVLPFWKRLAFQVTTEVPEGERLGFVILAKDGVEVMYQTRASIGNDIPALAERPTGAAFLFIEVDDVAAVEKAIATAPLMPRRTTFYGADELIVEDPAGNAVTFAQFAAAE
jgi:uncharacterized glyoxalase superfamily protein PhnB